MIDNGVSADRSPLVSVIVATYNSGPALRKTVLNILAQSYRCIEVVLIDGASTDGSLEQIADLLPRLGHVVSERDRGIADAYNKGIRAAKGDWIYFLNADDVFFDDRVVEKMVEQLRPPAAAVDLLVGTVVSDKGKVFDGRLGWRLLIRNQVHHQAIFYRSALLRSLPYNDAYRRYGHDHEHNIVMWKRRFKTRYVATPVCLWGTGGISDAAVWKDYREEFRIRRNTFGAMGWPLNAFTLLRFAAKRLRRMTARVSAA